MDLSKFVSQETVQRIYEWHKRMGDGEKRRGYLGASSIGHECERYLWYSFRHCVEEEFDGRMYRLFETGNLAEARFVLELKGIGCTVRDLDEQGNQFAVQALGGHFSGHMDGCVLGVPEAPETWHVVEFKTHSLKSFETLKKEGVQKSKPMHHAQMMVYMGLTGMMRALYLAVNKNTDELYGERVRFDSTEYKRLMDRAERIIRATNPPERCATRPDDFRCRFCPAFKLCWGTGQTAVPLPRKTCRTCCHATPEIDAGEDRARWSCAKHGHDLSREDQDKACDDHLLLPGLISFADPVDSGDGWIEFKNHSDGAIWRHGPHEGMWTTEELMKAPGPLVGEKSVQSVKEVLGASVVSVDDVPFEVPELNLVKRYRPTFCRLTWDGTPDDFPDKLKEDLLSDREVTEHFEDEQYVANEYGFEYLVVFYKADNYVAVWQGIG